MHRRGGTVEKSVRFRPGERQGRDLEHRCAHASGSPPARYQRHCPRGYSGLHFGRRFRPRWRATRHRRAQSPDRSADAHFPAGLTRLVVGVGGHGPHDVGQIDLLRHRRSIAVGVGEGEELTDHLVHPRAFGLDAVEVVLRIGSRFPPREFDGDVQPCQRRPQFVRDVGEQLFLCRRADAAARPSRRSRVQRHRSRRDGDAACRPHARLDRPPRAVRSLLARA